MLDRPATHVTLARDGVGRSLLAAVALASSLSTILASSSFAAEYHVWVHQLIDGQWIRQDDRTLHTTEFAKARDYLRTVTSYSESWTATTNLPEEEWHGTNTVDKAALAAHLTGAKTALDQRNLPRAVEEAGEAVALNGASADAYLYLGRAHLGAGALDKAIDAASHALAIVVTDRTRDFGTPAEKNATAHWLRGQARHLKREYPQACDDYSKALSLQAGLASQVLPKRARAYFSAGELEKTIADCDAVLSVTPRDALTLALRGQALEQKGEVDRGLADLNRAIQLLPRDAWVYMIRGDIRLRRKSDHRGALADFDEAIRRLPKEALLYDIRGDALASAGEFDAAVEDYTKAIELVPEAATFYHKRAVAWSGGGDYARALADLEEFLRRNPDSVQGLTNRGVLYKELGNLPRALADLDEALRREAGHFTARLEHARISARQGKFDVQSADLEQLVASAPDDAMANNELAWLRATCPEARYRDGAEAVKLATKACQLGNWPADHVATLAAACAEAGDFDSAVKWQQVALSDLRASKRPAAAAERRLAHYREHKPYRDYPAPADLAGRLVLPVVPRTPARALQTAARPTP